MRTQFKSYGRAPYGDARISNELNQIEIRLNQIRKGRGFRSMRKSLRRERDKLFAQLVANRLTED